MRRREVLVGMGAACASFPARAQKRLPTIAVLVLGGIPDGRPAPLLETILPALAEFGWVEGRTARIVTADGGGRLDDIAMLVADFVELPVDVLVAGGAVVTGKALTVTTAIPIVMSASGLDPVAAGWAQSYSRPGGNVTGLTTLNDEIVDKQLEILKELAPSTVHVGLLSTRGNAAIIPAVERARLAAGALGVRLTHGELSGSEDVQPALDKLVASGADALFALTDPVMDNFRNRLAEVASVLRLPSTSQLSFYADAGFLMTYAADLRDIHRRTALFVDRILRGESPAEIPIERPSKFVLRINARTARTIGVEIPPTILARADEVLE
jgi:putative tryptophan/tyrosine transport system substrate-binding protein